MTIGSTHSLLGRSGLRVSPLCLGTMTFGTEWGWGAPRETAFALLDRYLESGGNFIDTADLYTGGTSEAGNNAAFSKLLSEKSWRIVETVAQVATELGKSPAEVALNWVAHRPAVTSTIVGATRVDISGHTRISSEPQWRR